MAEEPKNRGNSLVAIMRSSHLTRLAVAPAIKWETAKAHIVNFREGSIVAVWLKSELMSGKDVMKDVVKRV